MNANDCESDPIVDDRRGTEQGTGRRCRPVRSEEVAAVNQIEASNVVE